MDTKPEKIKMKWYHFPRFHITREYLAGIIAGFGLGIIIMVWATDFEIKRLIFILGLALMSTGSLIERHIHNRDACDD